MRGTSGYLARAAFLASALFAATSVPSWAQEHGPRTIQIQRGTLATAIRDIAQQTGAEIATIEPRVTQQPVPAQILSGNAQRALKDLLRSTDFRAIRLGENSFRIALRPPATPIRKAVRGEASATDQAASDAIVVQGKFPTHLHDYPGSIDIFVPGKDQPAGPAQTSLAGIARRTPILASTAFGDGRDKLFVRGIADSSFNGASQPATSVYLGDALIGFGSPSTNVRLYDIRSVEILEGPQGTLFGSGTVGGVIRVTPNPVELDRVAGTVLGGANLTTGGDGGWKVAGTLNIPITADKIGIRLVGYDERSGGYIDNRFLGTNRNRIDVAGGRLAMTVKFEDGFSIDAAGIYQSTKARDSQYVESGGSLESSSTIAEPYSSEIALGHISLRKQWDNGLVLTSVATAGQRSTFDRFEAAARRNGKSLFDVKRSSTMVSSESQLASVMASAITWVAGLALEYSEDGQSRAIGLRDATRQLDEVTNITMSGSLFGQGRIQISHSVEGTLGVRYTMARTDSRPARGETTSFIKGHLARHFDPTIALLWHVTPQISVYGRFQTSYRNGGVTVAKGVGKIADFKSDSVTMEEVGFRILPSGTYGIALSGAISTAYWRDVLGELITRRGTAITSNIGNARLLTIEANVDWKTSHGWSLGASILSAGNHFIDGLSLNSAPRNRLLPIVPRFSATARASYAWVSDKRTEYVVGLNGQYVGRSVLGPGAFLDLTQGNYFLADLSASARRGPVTISIYVDNLFDTHANRFSLGNPLMLYRRDEHVPVRPRTVGFTVSKEW